MPVQREKIRKRGCSSSAGSSSVKQINVKKAILVGRRVGVTTPAPSWKMSDLSSATRSNISDDLAGGFHGSVSARTLISNLWKLNKIPSSSMAMDLKRRAIEENMKRRVSRELRSNLSTDDCTTEFHSCSRKLSPSKTHRKARDHLAVLQNNLSASKEIMKVLIHKWGPRELDSSLFPLVSALCAELDQARSSVRRLIRERRFKEGCCFRNLSKEAEAWKEEKERIRDAVESVLRDLEMQKKLRRQANEMNRKMKVVLEEMKEELAWEKRSRRASERAYDQLIRGIGKEKAQVEELRRAAAEVQEEIEKEREMLQLADEWREERVKMKLLEARHQFEEKNAFIDQLRDELEAVLTAKKADEPGANAKRLTRRDEGSDDSDAHSIELNMDPKRETYKWSYAAREEEEDSAKNILVEETIEMMRREFENSNEPCSSKANALDSEGEFDAMQGLEEGETISQSDRRREREARLFRDAERYNAVKELRDQLLAGARYFLPQGSGAAAQDPAGRTVK